MQILAWADQHHQRFGKWPTLYSGEVAGVPWEKWANIHQCLAKGLRGLHGGSSLARLLEKHRGVRNIRTLAPLSVDQILAWVDEHKRITGNWPNVHSGLLLNNSRESWCGIDRVLVRGSRGLPGGDTLARFLARHRGVKNHLMAQRLTVDKILAWADDHFARTGKWPGQDSGPVLAAPGEIWQNIKAALWTGGRGLPVRISLGKLLATRRGARNTANMPRLSLKQILAWADDHRRRKGAWPTESSGPVPADPRENWAAISNALRVGVRGLPGGSTLAQLLAQRRGHRNIAELPPLSCKKILAWADEHKRRTGRWPRGSDGAVLGQPGESWKNIQATLQRGGRGLKGRTSVSRLLFEHRGVRSHIHQPPLEIAQIMAWARAYRERVGRWPHDHSGPIPEAPGEGWHAVDRALRHGTRGLPVGLSLPLLLKGPRPKPAAVPPAPAGKRAKPAEKKPAGKPQPSQR